MNSDPFGTLGIAPTTDLAVIKRGYFAALQAHPPHSDPKGFARVRAAYEALQTPTGRAKSVFSAPIDLNAALRTIEARYSPQAVGASATEAAVADEAVTEEVATAFFRGLIEAPMPLVLNNFRAAKRKA